MQEWKNKGSRRRKQRRGLLSHWAGTAARVGICWSLARLSVCPSVLCHGDHRTRVFHPEWGGFPPWVEWVLSAYADGQAVPLSAPPRVAVVLCVGVSVRVPAVSHSGIVD